MVKKVIPLALEEIRSVTSNSYNRNNDVTYVYRVTTYLDTDTGKKVMKRHVVGKLAPDGSVVPTGKPGRPRIHPPKPPKKSTAESESVNYEALYSEAVKKNDYNQALSTNARRFAVEVHDALDAINTAINQLNSSVEDFLTRWK